MTATLIGTPLQISPAIFTDEQLQALARTYDTAGQPVWVHDLSARCLYQNPAAETPGMLHGKLVVFDIIDGRGHPIAQLTTQLD